MCDAWYICSMEQDVLAPKGLLQLLIQNKSSTDMFVFATEEGPMGPEHLAHLASKP